MRVNAYAAPAAGEPLAPTTIERREVGHMGGGQRLVEPARVVDDDRTADHRLGTLADDMVDDLHFRPLLFLAGGCRIDGIVRVAGMGGVGGGLGRVLGTLQAVAGLLGCVLRVGGNGRQQQASYGDTTDHGASFHESVKN